MRLRRRRSAAGFTLVEMVISAALMAVVLGAAYACLRAGLATRRVVEPRSDVFQTGRVAMSLIAADLRAACPLHKGPEFLGAQRQLGALDADNLDFATHNFTPAKPGEGDYCCVSWFVQLDPKTGLASLWRRRNPGLAFDPLSGGRREEIAANVRGFKVEYYDGYDWFATWGDPAGEAKQASSFRDRPNLVGMPEAARITLLLAESPTDAKSTGKPPAEEVPPLRFETVVRLNLAGAASGSSSAASSSGSPSTANPGQPNPGAPISF